MRHSVSLHPFTDLLTKLIRAEMKTVNILQLFIVNVDSQLFYYIEMFQNFIVEKYIHFYFFG